MIGMKRVSIFAAIALAVAVAGTPVHPAHAANVCSAAKNKKKGCKNEIKGCLGFVNKCKGLHGKAKAKCTKGCTTSTVAACKVNPLVCSASPSGAFLEL